MYSKRLGKAGIFFYNEILNICCHSSYGSIVIITSLPNFSVHVLRVGVMIIPFYVLSVFYWRNGHAWDITPRYILVDYACIAS
jgi:hypothetical protein